MKGVKAIGIVALVFLLGFGGAMAWNVADGRDTITQEAKQAKSSSKVVKSSSSRESSSSSSVSSSSSSSVSSSVASSAPVVSEATSQTEVAPVAQPAATSVTAESVTPAPVSDSERAVDAVIAYARDHGSLRHGVTFYITSNTGSVYQIESREDNPADPQVTSTAGMYHYDATTNQVTQLDDVTGEFK